MLQLSSTLLNRPVLSLRSGGQIGLALAPLINPDNLKIIGFFCEDRYEKQKELQILLSEDIREIIAQGFVVNDHDALTDPSELVRLKKIIDIGYEPLGKQVVTESKDKVGKINDYAVEMETMYIQKLYASQSILRNLTGGALSIDRNQIVEITNSKIIIKNPLQPTRSAKVAATA